MERYLIVDSKRPWYERTLIDATDRVIAHHDGTGEDYKVVCNAGLWYVENHEATKVHTFTDLFAHFRKGWKFFKMTDERIMRRIVSIPSPIISVNEVKEGDDVIAYNER